MYETPNGQRWVMDWDIRNKYFVKRLAEAKQPAIWKAPGCIEIEKQEKIMSFVDENCKSFDIITFIGKWHDFLLVFLFQYNNF